ncbi:MULTISPECIES: tetratricopeptide repeat protein [Leptospira]|uniref:Tetratricopeptide repeat protein n=6 Tax=Leptospira santarosai TaxID=28183 RepID=A0AB73MRW9_9LEPT|nr:MULTISPECIES: tetratricopeptide repeat protein [Leptospira]EMO56621.1 tetratricopeptide repeat protein [Leptospira santarosai str. CBC1416]ASV11123.1 tetratricopeptide repeat protein [Leptospira santarosai]AVV50058.1 Tetratricopeptide repeat protein [Leptospira santarosai]EKO35833.1 tetratricopeptide repeat protein [Leptospira santarosai str. MOR084]EKO79190.1 tetratricopeptide repeat protein [Leptospira sp. Fiocruz LV3954]
MISETMKQTIQFYNEGLSFYKTRKFTEALEKFKKAVELTPDDGPSKKYIGRCQAFIATPPPADWDGVFEMKTK